MRCRCRRRARWPHVVVTVLLVGACSRSAGEPDVRTDSTTARGPQVSLGDARVVDVALAATRQPAAPLGRPIDVTLSMHNRGARSVTISVALTLSPPSGAGVVFHDEPIFVPRGQTITQDVRVTPAQWFAALGRYEITVTANDAPKPVALPIEVLPADLLIPVFEDATRAAGIMSSVPAARCGQFSNGAAWGDVDGDRDLDLFVTRLGDAVQLFVNDGRGRFGEEAGSRGLALSDANGAAFADYDNDGDDDLVVVRDGPDVLFRNDGNGRFRDVSQAAGIGDPGYRGMSAAWADFDGDGHVDLYVTNYMHCLGTWSTEAEVIAQVGYYPDALYRNNGDGTFADVTSYLEHDPSTHDDGTTIGAGFTASWFDYNGDRRPDLYLANDFVGPSPDHNRLWRNDGPTATGWAFTDVSLDSGAALFMNTMGIATGDVDRDGDPDLVLSNIGGNKLLRNDGAGAFAEEEAASGAARPTVDAGYLSVTWGTALYDLNLDGWEDLYLAAGNFQRAPGTPVGVQPNQVFVNDTKGAFLDVSSATGADDRGDSKGIAVADYDGDGDLDVFVTNQGGDSRLLRNVTPHAANHWLEVDLVGTRSNRGGCGAVVTAHTSHGAVEREMSCGSGGSGSAHQRVVHLGLGADAVVQRLEITWPSGTTQRLTDVAVDRILTVEEPKA